MPKSLGRMWRPSIIAILLATLTALWFGSFRYHTFMGDDLQILIEAQEGGYASSLSSAFTEVLRDKYRPIFVAVFHAEIAAFDEDFRWFIRFNTLLQIVNACLVAGIAWRLSRRSWFAALAAGVIVIVSRFAYYYVITPLGSLEGLSLLFFLLTVGAVLRAYETKSDGFMLAAVAFFGLSIFTHERYMAVGPFLLLAALLAPNRQNGWLRRMGLALLPVLLVASNYAVKTFVFGSRFFEGTGDQMIVLDPQRFASFLWSGSLSLIGFNVGPEYLVGLSLARAGNQGLLLGSLFSGAIALTLLLYINGRLAVHTRGQWAIELRNLILFVALLGGLMGVACVTVLQEHRWLYGPYIVLVFGLVWMSARVPSSRNVGALLMALVMVSAVGVDTFYRGHVEKLYWIEGHRVADSARAVMIDKYGPALAHHEVYFITDGSHGVYWFFLGDAFFQFYTGEPQVTVNYVDYSDDLVLDPKQVDRVLVFALDVLEQEVVDLTLEVREIAASRPHFFAEHTFDFLQAFPDGQISNERNVGTPTGRGALEIYWPGELGRWKTLTVISGFHYRYDDVPVGEDEVLSFYAAIPFDQGDGALAYIEVTAGSSPQLLFSAELSPADGMIQWQEFVVPLGVYAGKSVSITFGVESPSGDSTADWVAFARPRLVPAIAGDEARSVVRGSARLLEDFPTVSVIEPSVEAPPVSIRSATVNGVTRTSLHQHPRSEVSFSLQVPHQARLRFGIGIDSQCAGQGDGATFTVAVQHGNVIQEVFSEHIGSDAERDWSDQQIDLSDYAGQTVLLVFITGPGPYEHFDCDWAVWSDPTIWRGGY